MPTAQQQKTVLETVLEWSADRPAWQRDALRRIVQKGRLDDTDIEELAALCKQGKGATGIQANPTVLEKGHLPANPGAGDSVELISLKDITGANILAPGQTLPFGPKCLTVIYGDNGAGKSGYARILKRACRARHPGVIEGNIYAQQPSGPAKATVTYSIGGSTKPSEQWQDAEHPHPTLSAVSVFDSACADIHIEGKNEVAFRPFGLDVPDELAGACQRVKDLLVAEQKQLEKARNPLFVKPPWKEQTAVGKYLGSLRHDSDTKKLSALATLSDEEIARLDRLKEDLSKDPVKASAEQKLKAANIKSALDAISLIEAQTTDTALESIFLLDRQAKSKREAARIAANKAFSGERLKDIGGQVWRALWDAARRYSTQVAYPDQPFPSADGDPLCVLCHQPLEPEAVARMARFENFVQEDTEQQAQEAEKAAKAALDKLTTKSIATRLIASHLREVEIQNKELAQEARRSIAAARLRRYCLVRELHGDASALSGLPKASSSPKEALTKLEATVRQYSVELQNSSKGEERKRLQTELAELSDRATLHEIAQTVQDESARLQGIHFLEQCFADTTTNAITKLGNEIADSIITPQLRDRFQEEIIKLAAHKVRVEIVRSGGKFGSPQYQIRLFAKPDAKVAVVLSEGEKTCVALAAFMTELATATHRSTLVFDDPVSSLDHRWRKQVAKRLVEEAGSRQIIVFTHDLVFVNDLLDLAHGQNQTPHLVTVSREQPGAGVVSDGLPWTGKSVEDRIDKLEKDSRTARDAYDNHQEDSYRQQAASIYNRLRATWERALEDVAFFRVIRRHRDYIETKNLKKASVLTEADCEAFQVGFKKCCDVTDAHDPSAGRNAEAPPPNEVDQDIQALKAWVASIRTRQAAIK